MGNLRIRWKLVLYDLAIFLVVALILLGAFNYGLFTTSQALIQGLVAFVLVELCRIFGNVYGQIWRYGGVQSYLRLVLTDAVAFVLYAAANFFLPMGTMSYARAMSLICLNLLGALSMRMFYRYAFKCATQTTGWGRFLTKLLDLFADLEDTAYRDTAKIKIAIIGAGRVGVALAEELLNNRSSSYTPRCFVDISEKKIGREIHGIPVFPEDEAVFDKFRSLEIQEIVFALPAMDADQKKKLYEQYKPFGAKIKVYDYPLMQAANGRRAMREFDVEELLFRKPLVMESAQTNAYYAGKVILITGGGGSIGSELARQIARMHPKQLILLDIYENGVYDVQQQLKYQYRDTIDLPIVIASITNRSAMERVFETYRPEIVINAAAHKHVPLMEHNCIEAVENNVFGTKLLTELAEEFGAKRFMMVSTDKAVNPTNVMGATKRMCEMIVQTAGLSGKVCYSATRFGNVLGSAGSVIPLFRRQIANGGPITITDKRIIRYFMTIPEASQLVLQSGAMAKNGELFVLDMGKPVKILDLAENMIRLSGVANIEIVETGLRPGEKLYEELLVKAEELDKTENNLIFIERDQPVSEEDLAARLALLKEACESGSDEQVKNALHAVVPTYRKPEEVNKGIGKEVDVQKVDFVHQTAN